jgi:hypothetical protein
MVESQKSGHCLFSLNAPLVLNLPPSDLSLMPTRRTDLWRDLQN